MYLSGCADSKQMASAKGLGLDALLRAIEQRWVPARTGRALCNHFRQNASFLQLQHQQDARTEHFWRQAPEQQLLDAVSSDAVSASDLCEGASMKLLERDFERVVAAMDERGLLAPAGDTAAQQALFDAAVVLAGGAALRTVRGLLARYPAIDLAARDNAAVLACARNGNAAMLRLLLADGRSDPGADSDCALRDACWENHVEVVRLLLADARVNPTALNNAAIRMVSRDGHIEIVRLLLADPRVDPTARGNQAIEAAQSNGHTEVVQLLLADGRAKLPG